VQIHFIYIDVNENGKTCPMLFLNAPGYAKKRKEKNTSKRLIKQMSHAAGVI
jgi:hypothetical protein